MNMVRYRYYLGLVIPMLLASCESANITDEPAGKSNALVIRAMAGGSSTRASGSNWDKGDEIGVSVGGTQTYRNVKYRNTSESGPVGIFENVGNIPVTLNPGETHDVYAYYPFMGVEGKTVSVPIDFTDQSKAFDIMWAPLTTVDGSHPDLNLEFEHQLCRYRFIVECDEDVDVRDCPIFLSGLSMRGTFSIDATGKPSITVNSEDSGPFKIGKAPAETGLTETAEVYDIQINTEDNIVHGYTVEGLILPQDAPAFILYLGDPTSGNEFRASNPGRLRFNPGELCIFRVGVRKDSKSFDMNCSISRWGYGSSLIGKDITDQ